MSEHEIRFVLNDLLSRFKRRYTISIVTVARLCIRKIVDAIIARCLALMLYVI